MSFATKKLVTIITEATIEKELLELLEEQGVTGYTITDARGKGHRGVRDSSWEFGSNIRVEIVCEQKIADKVSEYLKKNYYDNYAMIIFVREVEVLRPEKF